MSARRWFLGRGCLLLCTLIWGTSFVVLKDTLDYLPTMFILAVRFTIGALLLLLIQPRQFRGVDRRGVVGGMLMGAFLFAGYVFQTYGLLSTSPGVNAFLTAAYCVMVPFFGWLLRDGRPDGWNVAAAALCLCGMALICLQSGLLRIGRGELLTICCGVFFSMHILLTARCVRSYSPLMLSTLQFSVCAVLCWAGVLFEGVPVPKAVPVGAWLSLGYLCLFCTVATFLLQTLGQKYTPPSAAAVILTLEAVFGTAFSVLLYGERPTGRMYLGFAVIFLSVLVSETKLSFLRLQKKQS